MDMRLAVLQDLPQILEIISHAQQYLAQQNIDQWQDAYPPKEWIINDITQNDSYVILNDTNQIVATTVFVQGPEPTYKVITGSWLTDSNAKYAVIHRLAIHKNHRRKGIAEFIFKAFENKLKNLKFNSMRIDTHKDNTGMQRLLKKMGYVYCGVIYLDDGNERLAFEKVLNAYE